MSGIRLTTERLCLRDHRPGDLATHAALFCDKAAMRYLPELYQETERGAEQNLLAAIDAARQSPRDRVFLRVETKEGRHIGEIGYTITRTTPEGAFADLGYFSRPDCWGQGFMPEAAKALLAYAFTEGGVFRIHCGCIKENRASERVMQKAGLIFEARLQKADYHEGRFKDRLSYYLLRDQWLRRRALMEEYACGYAHTLGRLVSGTIDRPLGSFHPRNADLYYPLNYGEVDGVTGGDGAPQDVYLMGIDKPLAAFQSLRVIAVVHRLDDDEDKWVLAPPDAAFTKEQVHKAIHFQEQYFISELYM